MYTLPDLSTKSRKKFQPLKSDQKLSIWLLERFQMSLSLSSAFNILSMKDPILEAWLDIFSFSVYRIKFYTQTHLETGSY